VLPQVRTAACRHLSKQVGEDELRKTSAGRIWELVEFAAVVVAVVEIGNEVVVAVEVVVGVVVADLDVVETVEFEFATIAPKSMIRLSDRCSWVIVFAEKHRHMSIVLSCASSRPWHRHD
jgi:hypothetical protein